ncbi:amidohydrolase [Echinicola strongylocentroti]|uniref:Amidohydrolase n=1 Tax=Echinicola strongylocentroti TaxID=1795355 RepID=A0A2Z4IFQ3_9BACT|nr:amidohydrolase [Echinicola strongylocentroti]AWW29922.1 amidohydrolase [Echinicola strongylocentroti]
MKRIYSLLIGLSFLLLACNKKEPADLIVHNGLVYTVNSDFDQATAFAVKDGKFLEVNSNENILQKYSSSKTIDLEGQFVYPGLIDAHTHFYRYGTGLKVADLTGISSFQSLVETVKEHRKEHPDLAWILGRGWDQNLWPEKEFPEKSLLDKAFPDTPVLLTRIDGHAAIANQKALDLGGISANTSILGGKVILKIGQPTGVLIDNAIDQVSSKIPDITIDAARQALLDAQKNCFAVGLTTVVDAGLDKSTIDLIESMQQEGSLKMRVYAMINPTEKNKAHYFEKGPFQNESLTVRSFKIYGDGALGSRGASLLAPYHDAPNELGFLLNTPENFLSLAQEIHAHGFQMNTHCIGDSANRTLLDIYAKVLMGKNDQRWRIEHAQVVHPQDIQKFAKFNIIPSVQPTHATSDMYWAEDRLGHERIKHAYTYKDLMQQNGLIALGSDFPVENINPLFGFHAAIARQDDNNWPKGGFQPENSLTREQALKGMTIWAAYANFEEHLKGSIEKGKLADFIITKKDLMTAPEETLRDIKVQATFLGGEKVN